MTKAVHADVLDKGPNEIKTRANIAHLVPASTSATYAATAAAAIAASAMTSSDYGFSTSGSDRLLTPVQKTITPSGACSSGADMEWRFSESSTSTILWRAGGTAASAIAIGTPLVFTLPTYTSQQPI